MAFLVGQHVGAYEVISLIDVGGMGSVYRAIDTRLNRPVAIKVLSDTLANTEARRRFQREAQSASSLNPPHIVVGYDAGEFDDQQHSGAEIRERQDRQHTTR